MRRVHMTVDVDVLLSCSSCFDFMNRRGASDDSMKYMEDAAHSRLKRRAALARQRYLMTNHYTASRHNNHRMLLLLLQKFPGMKRGECTWSRKTQRWAHFCRTLPLHTLRASNTTHDRGTLQRIRPMRPALARHTWCCHQDEWTQLRE